MYRKDLISPETTRLSKVLEQLKHPQNRAERNLYRKIADDFFRNDLHLEATSPDEVNPETFRSALLLKKYAEAELDLLCKIMYESALLYELQSKRKRFQLTLLVLDILEKTFHVQTLPNLALRSSIEEYLNNEL